MTSDEETHSKGLPVMQDLTEKTLATERKYTGKIISVDLLDIELPDGHTQHAGAHKESGGPSDGTWSGEPPELGAYDEHRHGAGRVVCRTGL